MVMKPLDERAGAVESTTLPGRVSLPVGVVGAGCSGGSDAGAGRIGSTGGRLGAGEDELSPRATAMPTARPRPRPSTAKPIATSERGRGHRDSTTAPVPG